MLTCTLCAIETSFVASDCLDGEVRLAGGVNNATGRVEVCFDSAWGSICSNSFGSLDAQVVCHQLGFIRDGEQLLKIAFVLMHCWLVLEFEATSLAEYDF